MEKLMNKFIIAILWSLYSISGIQTMPKVSTSQSQLHTCSYPGCTKSYKTAWGLHNHIDVKHKNIRYKCPYEGCDKEYSRNSTLDNHIDAEHKNLKYKCSYEGCNAAYQYPQNLTNHINVKHKNITHKCTHEGCDKKYRRKDELDKHINVKHKNITLKCPYEGCNKEYNDNSRLNYHINSIHKKIKHICHYTGCNKSFTKKTSLIRHINSAHENEDQQSDAEFSDNDSDNNQELLIIEPDNKNRAFFYQDSSLSPAMLLEQFNIALDVDNIELAQQLIETASIDEINTIKSQLLYAIIMKNNMKNKISLIAALNNKN